jgi:hypothetical protein
MLPWNLFWKIFEIWKVSIAYHRIGLLGSICKGALLYIAMEIFGD